MKIVFDTSIKNPKGFIFKKNSVPDPSVFKATLFKRDYITKEKLTGRMQFIDQTSWVKSELDAGSKVNVFKTKDGKYFAYTIWNLPPNSNGSKTPRHFISNLYFNSKDNTSLKSLIPKPKYTFEDLQQKLQRHDWSYEMSDDSRTWDKGSKQKEEIRSIIDFILKNNIATLQDVKSELYKYTSEKAVGQYPPEAYLPRGYK